jgi:hypothetical protein
MDPKSLKRENITFCDRINSEKITETPKILGNGLNHFLRKKAFFRPNIE